MMVTSNYSLVSPLIKGLTTAESARLEGTFPGLPSVANCVTCHGTKTFRWYRPDTRDADSVVTYDCPCPDQYALHRRLLHSGVYENFQRLGWVDFDRPREPQDVVADYLRQAQKFVSVGFGMVLYGPKGNGKTLLANLMIKNLIGQGFDCYANTFSTMISTFADGWTDKEDRVWFDRKVRNADVLLIDDLGRERNKGGSATLGENALEEIIRHRVARSKPTLITTNHSIEDVESGYGGHTMSLLRECSANYRFTGSDYRQQMNIRTANEIALGLTRPIVVG